MSEHDKPLKPATRLVEGGRREEWTGAVVNPPVWRGSTHLYADSADLAKGRANEDGQFYYGRRGSPTQWALAEALTELEPGAAGHDLWRRDFTGGCGLLSFVLAGRDEAARARFIDALELFGIGYSWGGFESLAIPFDAGRVRTASPWPPRGWRSEDRLGVRLSLGLEDAADLIADLTQAFAAMDRA